MNLLRSELIGFRKGYNSQIRFWPWDLKPQAEYFRVCWGGQLEQIPKIPKMKWKFWFSNLNNFGGGSTGGIQLNISGYVKETLASLSWNIQKNSTVFKIFKLEIPNFHLILGIFWIICGRSLLQFLGYTPTALLHISKITKKMVFSFSNNFRGSSLRGTLLKFSVAN